MSEVKVERMTPAQQIERLIRQRNALWRLIDKFSIPLEDDEPGAELYDKAQEIMGNMYLVEGVNSATGDIDRVVEPYARIAVEMGRWI